MKNLLHLIAISVIVFTATNCSKKSSPTSAEPYLQLNTQAIELPGGIASDTIYISSNVSWTVTKNSEASWLTIEQTTGNGDGKFILKTTDSNLFMQRSAHLEIKSTSGDKSVTMQVNQSILKGLVKHVALGGENNEELTGFALTDDGGYLAVGYTQSLSGDASGNGGGTDVWVVKFDSLGNKQWHKCYGGPGFQSAGSIMRTSTGNYIISGHIDSSEARTNVHGLLLCINGAGSLLWQKTIGGPDNDRLGRMIRTQDGNFLLAGTTYTNTGRDGWVVKINEQGSVLWSRTYGSSGDDDIYDVLPTTDGGYVFTGTIVNNDGDATDKPAGSTSWFVKAGSDGTIEHRTYLPESAVPSDIVELPDGNFLCAGGTFVEGGFDGYHADRDVFVMKLSTDGNVFWKKAFGGSEWDSPQYISTTEDGKIVVAAVTKSADGDISLNAGTYDAWLLTLDGDGRVLSNQTFGGPGFDVIHYLKPVSNNTFVFAGYTESYMHNYPQLDNRINGWFGMINLE